VRVNAWPYPATCSGGTETENVKSGLPTAATSIGIPLARVYCVISQLPEPRWVTLARSLVAVVRSKPPGTVRLDEFVSVRAPLKRMVFSMPAGDADPKLAIVVVPVIVTLACGTELRSVVEALAIDPRPPPMTPTYELVDGSKAASIAQPPLTYRLRTHGVA
jgi:hypothetical protein